MTVNKTAKEMFEELGYKYGVGKKEGCEGNIYCTKYVYDTWLGRDDVHQTIYFYIKGTVVVSKPSPIKPDVLKAIHKQMEELGWL